MKPTAHSLRPTFSGLVIAFTLVELMVVVAIISILLTLLIPNIRIMREKAWSAHCQNNLRQYGIAMNQYMVDWNGDFVYRGAGGVNAGTGKKGDTDPEISGGRTISMAPYSGGVLGLGGIAGTGQQWWPDMIAYVKPGGVTLQSLSEGQPSARVCPAVLQQIKKDGNFFDPKAPNFKGIRTVYEYDETWELPDFADRWAAIDDNNNLVLDSAFTTYAITPSWQYTNKKDIPENAIAFIDWNAREGWGWLGLGGINWAYTGIDSKGAAVTQDTPKWTNAWWLTEVGFNHLQGNVYGANYVAMDGHVGWVGSNTISITNFTTGLK